MGSSMRHIKPLVTCLMLVALIAGATLSYAAMPDALRVALFFSSSSPFTPDGSADLIDFDGAYLIDYDGAYLVE